MRAELSIFVNENYSIEKQGLFTKCFSIFEDYSLEDYDTPFIELISEFDSRDYLDVVDNFESLIKNTLVSVINEQGLTVSEDSSLEIISEIASALFDIQYYDNKEEILRCLEVESDSEEKIANVLSLVCLVSVENLLINITSVDENIFNLLAQLCSYSDSETSEPEEQTKADKDIINKLKKFKEFTKSDDLIAFRIIKKGFRVRLNYDFYNRYLKNLITDFTDIEKVAKEYFAVLLMSKESYLNPINHFRKISSSINDDISLITKLDIQISKLFNDFDKFCISSN